MTDEADFGILRERCSVESIEQINIDIQAIVFCGGYFADGYFGFWDGLADLADFFNKFFRYVPCIQRPEVIYSRLDDDHLWASFLDVTNVNVI